jgi:hypothetical protein
MRRGNLRELTYKGAAKEIVRGGEESAQRSATDWAFCNDRDVWQVVNVAQCERCRKELEEEGHLCMRELRWRRSRMEAEQDFQRADESRR